jgi:transmembrane sensor
LREHQPRIGTPHEHSSPHRELVRPVDVAKVTGWREGQVFLEDLSLADAVAEMNRYSRVQIVLGDEPLAKLRVNGMFRAGEQSAFVAALQEYFPVTVRRESDTRMTLLTR